MKILLKETYEDNFVGWLNHLCVKKHLKNELSHLENLSLPRKTDTSFCCVQSSQLFHCQHHRVSTFGSKGLKLTTSIPARRWSEPATGVRSFRSFLGWMIFLTQLKLPVPNIDTLDFQFPSTSINQILILFCVGQMRHNQPKTATHAVTVAVASPPACSFPSMISHTLRHNKPQHQEKAAPNQKDTNKRYVCNPWSTIGVFSTFSPLSEDIKKNQRKTWRSGHSFKSNHFRHDFET